MKPITGTLAICLFLLAACAPAQPAAPTPIPTESPTAGPSPTPPAGFPVRTAWGTYVITSVVHANRLPPDCDINVDGSCTQKAAPGDHTLILYWQPVSQDATRPASADVLNSGAYIIANTGAQCPLVSSGKLPNGDYIAFEIPAASYSYTLYWPNNPPINLNP